MPGVKDGCREVDYKGIVCEFESDETSIFWCGSGYMTVYLLKFMELYTKKKEKFIVCKLCLNKHSRKKLIPASQQTEGLPYSS